MFRMARIVFNRARSAHSSQDNRLAQAPSLILDQRTCTHIDSDVRYYPLIDRPSQRPKRQPLPAECTGPSKVSETVGNQLKQAMLIGVLGRVFLPEEAQHVTPALCGASNALRCREKIESAHIQMTQCQSLSGPAAYNTQRLY